MVFNKFSEQFRNFCDWSSVKVTVELSAELSCLLNLKELLKWEGDSGRCLFGVVTYKAQMAKYE